MTFNTYSPGFNTFSSSRTVTPSFSSFSPSFNTVTPSTSTSRGFTGSTGSVISISGQPGQPGQPGQSAQVGSTTTFSAPSFSAPTFSAPTVSVPTFSAPTVSVPTFSAPTVSTTTFNAPTVNIPTVSTPTFSTPTVVTSAVGGSARGGNAVSGNVTGTSGRSGNATGGSARGGSAVSVGGSATGGSATGGSATSGSVGGGTTAPANKAPVANRDVASTPFETSVMVDVLSNDTDRDGDDLTIRRVKTPSNGTAQIVDGKVVYTPDAGFSGSDTFDYIISDGNGGRDTSSVTVFVGSAPDPVVGSIAGQVRNDVDGDGDLSDPDAGISGVTVQLFTDNDGDFVPDGAAIATTTTDANGNYSFGSLGDATYIVEQTNLDGFTSTADANGFNLDRIGGLTIDGGNNITSQDFLDTADASDPDPGVGKPPAETGSISGQVRNDADGDGDLSDSDAGISGVTVQLFTDNDGDFVPDGAAIATTTTDANGNYSFGSLGDATYIVEQTNLDGFTSTADANGFNLDRIGGLTIDGGNGFTGQDFLDTASGGKPPAETGSISGQVRNDVDGDGNLSDPDAGISGVTVQLFSDNDGDFVPDGAAIATTTTDANGNYSFDSLGDATYIVEQTNLDGFTSTADANGFNLDRIGGLSIDGGNNITGQDFLDTPDAPPNSAPDAVNDSETTVLNTPVTIHVLDNDSDPEGDDLTITSVEDPANGSTAIVDGKIVYTPDTNFSGMTTFDYAISDGNGGADTASVTVSVLPDKSSKVDLPSTRSISNLLYRPDGSSFGRRNGISGGLLYTRISIDVNEIEQALGSVDVNRIVKVEGQDQFTQRFISSMGARNLVERFDTVSDSRFAFGFYAGFNGSESSFESRARRFEGDFEITYELGNGEYHTNHFSVDFEGNQLLTQSPISFDLNNDGIQTLGIDQGVRFDMLNTGEAVNTGWLSGEDGFLAIDNDGDGLISSRAELFGGAVGEGFAKLASFDSTGDGLVNEADAQFGELKLWQDANENGITDQGELVALSSTGITDLSTAYTNVFSTDAQGNIHGEVSTAVKNGSTIEMTDVYFQVQA